MRGRILFNGNAGVELFERVAPFLRGAAPGRTPRVLVVTAAWGAGERRDEGVHAALRAQALPVSLNLGAWHFWTDLMSRRADVSAVWRETEEVLGAIRGFYLEKTAFHADIIRRGVAEARARVRGFSLGHVHARDPIRPEAVLTGAEIIAHALSRELLASIDALVQNDARMLLSLSEAEDQLHARTGLRLDPEWREVRARLEERILGADALVFLGGSPTELLGALRFFDLQPALLEALRRGATFVATSAGALVMCERIVVYDQGHGDPNARDFRLIDRGLGLVGGLQVLPHCMDRIQTDDPDNLAYLARRFSSRICVGLNEGSYLLVDMARPALTAVGTGDAVYVFGSNGNKRRYAAGEEIEI